MGTSEGIKHFKPRYSERLKKTYAYIPKGYAAHSAAAFAALKAQVLVCEGTLGFHRLYKIENGQKITTPTQDLMLGVLMITAYGGPHGDLIEPNDLEGTTGRLFFVRTLDERFDHQLVDWHDLRDAEYEIKSTSDALVPCGNSPSMG